MKPRLMHSGLSGNFWIVTRYKTSPIVEGGFVAQTKYEATQDVAAVVVPMIEKALADHRLMVSLAEPAQCSCGFHAPEGMWTVEWMPVWRRHVAMEALGVKEVTV